MIYFFKSTSQSVCMRTESFLSLVTNALRTADRSSSLPHVLAELQYMNITTIAALSAMKKCDWLRLDLDNTIKTYLELAVHACHSSITDPPLNVCSSATSG